MAPKPSTEAVSNESCLPCQLTVEKPSRPNTLASLEASSGTLKHCFTLISMPIHNHPQRLHLWSRQSQTHAKRKSTKSKMTAWSPTWLPSSRAPALTPRSMQSVLVSMWTSMIAGSTAWSAWLSITHTHMLGWEGNIFTWQHQKNDVPKGEIRTD